MDKIFRLRKYLEYQWKAKTKYYIHSPFVYQFYLNVLEGKEIPSAKDKYQTLLHRLTTYFNVHNVFLLGHSNADLQYLLSGNLSVTIINNAGTSLQTNNSIPFHLVVCNGKLSKQSTLEYFRQILPHMKEDSIFILSGIYTREEITQVWEEIKGSAQVTLTIDLFICGICFFRKEKLTKENFVLRY